MHRSVKFKLTPDHGFSYNSPPAPLFFSCDLRYAFDFCPRPTSASFHTSLFSRSVQRLCSAALILSHGNPGEA
jgi:hypothetical protein